VGVGSADQEEVQIFKRKGEPARNESRWRLQAAGRRKPGEQTGDKLPEDPAKTRTGADANSGVDPFKRGKQHLKTLSGKAIEITGCRMVSLKERNLSIDDTPYLQDSGHFPDHSFRMRRVLKEGLADDAVEDFASKRKDMSVADDLNSGAREKVEVHHSSSCWFFQTINPDEPLPAAEVEKERILEGLQQGVESGDVFSGTQIERRSRQGDQLLLLFDHVRVLLHTKRKQYER